MSQINELEGRITAALDRIGQGLDTLALPPAEDPVAAEALAHAEAALADERLANAQLEERVKSLTERLDETAEVRAKLSGLRESVAALETALSEMRRTQADLDASSHALRHAASAGATDPELINTALQAEVDALRAARAADVAEASAILTALDPLIPSDTAEENA